MSLLNFPGKATLEIKLNNSSENFTTEVGSILTVTGKLL